MKVIIAGSRDVNFPYAHVKNAIQLSGFTISEVVSGTARGIDAAGEFWANCHSIPIKQFPADWEQFGRSAGYIRNREMAKYAEALIAIWDGKSRGTANMIEEAQLRGLKIYIYRVPA